MRHFWFSRLLAVFVAASTLSACVTLSPASPSVAPTASPSPTAAATASPTPSLSPAPTTPPTDPATAPPTDAVTAPPTTPPTAEPTSGTADRLDFTLSPAYGRIDLEAGFVLDPATKDITSGGPVEVSYVADDCSGYAAEAPDLSVGYTHGGATPDLLRFYFIVEGDTTLIINDPVGNWICDDDSYGTTNPTIDFTDPAPGRYDVWVGSYNSEGRFPGTLYVTELDSNHP